MRAIYKVVFVLFVLTCLIVIALFGFAFYGKYYADILDCSLFGPVRYSSTQGDRFFSTFYLRLDMERAKFYFVYKYKLEAGEEFFWVPFGESMVIADKKTQKREK